ncbi:hypothetical protein BN12_1760005 [Nostocoides japonicum T1-X7]|uniref:Uncharacterized protein n=1 Tax=Nostocoides japonicum T1-X7 TaxID=1194083 RepID=A0A077LZ21_9MICO|nr:hypothetical protein BN12_1760005 [Tetrasphaera japonica T1-X7]
MGIAIFMYAVFAVGAVAIVAVLVRGIVNRRRHRDNGEWQDPPSDGEVRMHPGAGWGNGGSWR